MESVGGFGGGGGTAAAEEEVDHEAARPPYIHVGASAESMAKWSARQGLTRSYRQCFREVSGERLETC